VVVVGDGFFEELCRDSDGLFDGGTAEVLLDLLALLRNQQRGVVLHAFCTFLRFRHQAGGFTFARNNQRGLGKRGIGLDVLQVGLILRRSLFGIGESLLSFLDVLPDRLLASLETVGNRLLAERVIQRREKAKVDEQGDDRGTMLVKYI